MLNYSRKVLKNVIDHFESYCYYFKKIFDSQKMERNVTQWEKYESVSAKSKNSKNNQCKILMFRQKIK